MRCMCRLDGNGIDKVIRIPYGGTATELKLPFQERADIFAFMMWQFGIEDEKLL